MFYGWRIVGGGFMLLLIYGGSAYSFSIFVTPLEDTFEWSRAAISMAISIYWIGHGICAPFIGRLLQALGSKRVMCISTLLCGVFYVALSLTQSLWFYYAAFAMLSTVTVGIGYIPVSDIVSRWFVRRRGTAIGIAMIGISAGGLIMPPLVSEIVLRFGWRSAFVVLGILAWVVCLPIVLFFMKDSPQDAGLLPYGEEEVIPETGSDKKPYLNVLKEDWPFKAAIQTKAFIFSSLAFFFAPLAQAGLLMHQVPILLDIGISPTTAATALGLTASIGALGKLAFGRLSEIIQFKYAPMICFGLQALSILLLLNADSPVMLWGYVVLFGFSMGGVIVLIPLTVGHFFGLTAFGVIMGMLSFIQAMGSSCGALISGIIYDTFGSYRPALITYAGLYLIAVMLIFLAGKTRPYEQGLPLSG